jgi:hypothetical protein
MVDHVVMKESKNVDKLAEYVLRELFITSVATSVKISLQVMKEVYFPFLNERYDAFIVNRRVFLHPSFAVTLYDQVVIFVIPDMFDIGGYMLVFIILRDIDVHGDYLVTRVAPRRLLCTFWFGKHFDGDEKPVGSALSSYDDAVPPSPNSKLNLVHVC